MYFNSESFQNRHESFIYCFYLLPFDFYDSLFFRWGWGREKKSVLFSFSSSFVVWIGKKGSGVFADRKRNDLVTRLIELWIQASENHQFDGLIKYLFIFFSRCCCRHVITHQYIMILKYVYLEQDITCSLKYYGIFELTTKCVNRDSSLFIEIPTIWEEKMYSY